MASIINKIAFKNFFNYYGEYEENTYHLEEGINIIVADNGAGKSKFFNAFLWLFYDQVLDSDTKQKLNIRNIYHKILSDKAKIETGINESVDCGIEIEYTGGTRYKYQVVKSFTSTRIGENIDSKNSWQFTENDVEVSRTELVLHRYKPVFDEEKKRQIINKLIMPTFRQYSFLQGEEVDDIIDFGKRESIEKAVENLTDIKEYEEINELLSEFKNKAFRELQKQNKTKSEDSTKLNNALQEKERIETQLKQEEEKLTSWKKAYAQAENERNELDKQFANAEKRKELDDKLRPLNKELKEKKEEFEVFLDRINNRFFDGGFAWIAYGFQEQIGKYNKLYDKYIENRYQKKALQEVEERPNDYFHILPEGSPDTVSLGKMIKNEHCYVCNREAKEGTEAYNNIVKLKERPKNVPSKKPFVKNDLKNFFGNIQINAQPFYNRIDDIPESIIKTKEKEGELKSAIERLRKKVNSLKDERNDIPIAGKDADVNAREIVSNYKGAIRRMEDAKFRINEKISPKITDLKKKLKSTVDEINNLGTSHDIPEGYKIHSEILTDLEEAAQNAKDRIFDNMVALLEKHSNEHFQNLTKNNDLAGGILKFEKNPDDSIDFTYVDSKNNTVYGSSEGFQRMKKFSVVMAIITANNSEYNYPLLADAPISAFGENFTEGFFEAIGEVFPQSIVLVKELYKKDAANKINELGERLLKDPHVKKMYVNHVPENAEQMELFTTKTTLK